MENGATCDAVLGGAARRAAMPRERERGHVPPQANPRALERIETYDRGECGFMIE